eukprot:5777937-Amphidinium_carterae.1
MVFDCTSPNEFTMWSPASQKDAFSKRESLESEGRITKASLNSIPRPYFGSCNNFPKPTSKETSSTFASVDIALISDNE